MMKRKFLGLFLAICLIAGLLPAVMVGAETTATNAPTTAPAPETTTAATTAPTTQPTAAPSTEATTVPSTGATTAPTTAPSTAASTAATTKATESTKQTRPATTEPSVTTPPETTPTTAPTGPVNPTAGAFSVSIKLCETSSAQTYLAVLTASKGGEPVYAVTNEDGIPIPVTDGSVPTDNYIKFEYPQNDLPTITLMNAKLRSSGNILDLSSFDIAVKIMVVGNSSFESTTKCGIVRASYGDITILGPSTLTLNCYSSAIAFEGDGYPNSLILKELTLKATTSANASGRVFQIPAGNLTVDGSSLDLINRAGIAVFLGQGSVADAKSRGNATISNSVISINSKNASMQLDGNLILMGTNMQLASDARTLYCGGNMTATNSTLFLEGRSNTQETVCVGGEFTLRTSNAEIVSIKNTLFDANTIPNLIGEYTVIAGLDRVSATTYDEALLSTYQYLFAESVVRPTDLPTTPTDETIEPTDFFTEPTTAPIITPTIAPITIPTSNATTSTQPVPTIPVNSNPTGGNSVLFWILAVVMILGAGGAVTMAVLMIRKNAQAGLDDDSQETVDP